MNWTELGEKHSKTVMLLHGGGLSTWNFRDAAEELSKDYHVILPVLDGHGGSARPFRSIEDNAAYLLGEIEKNFHGKVDLLAGLSLGGQIALEMAAQNPHCCSALLLESTLAIPMSLTAKLVKPSFSLCYPLIKQRWFAKAQFASYHIKKELFEDYYQDSCAISKDSLIAMMAANTSYQPKESLKDCKAKTLIMYGDGEIGSIKRSAQKLHQLLPNSRVEVIPNCKHGQWSIDHGKEYACRLGQLLEEVTE